MGFFDRFKKKSKKEEPQRISYSAVVDGKFMETCGYSSGSKDLTKAFFDNLSEEERRAIRRSPTVHLCANCKKEITGSIYVGGGKLFCVRCGFGAGKLTDRASAQVEIHENGALPYFFQQTNSDTVSPQQHQQIVDAFMAYYAKYYLVERKSPVWAETEDALMLRDEWDWYAYHDGTLFEFFHMIFRKEEQTEVPEWDPPKDWPCKGQKIVQNQERGTDVREGWVDYSLEKTWLLSEPFDIPGIWSIALRISRNRIL